MEPQPQNPGNFKPYEGPSVPPPVFEAPTTHVNLTVDQIAKAGKYCKWAGSALNFDDVSTAIENLQKALHLLTTGKEML